MKKRGKIQICQITGNTKEFVQIKRKYHQKSSIVKDMIKITEFQQVPIKINTFSHTFRSKVSS